MKKIPVGATIAHAYGFAFRSFFDLVKLIWLPFAISMSGMVVLGSQAAVLSEGMITHDYSALTMPWAVIALVYLVALLMGLMQMAAIYQYALGQPGVQKRWIYFSFGMPLWRLIGAVALLILALVGLVLVYAIAVALVLFVFRLGLGAAHISAAAIQTNLAFDAVLATTAGYCGFIFCALRFGFLLAAATLAEGRIGLFRSWTLSHGNFWRMFAILMAIFLPFVALELVVMYFGGLFPHLPPPGATAADLQLLREQQAAMQAAVMLKVQHYWFLSYPAFGVFAVLLYGVLAGAQSFAYRLLTDGDASHPPASSE